MAGETARVGRVFSPSAGPSQSMASTMNPPGVLDPSLYRKPDFFVYLYSTSDRSFEISQPPLVSRMIIPARPAGEPYVCFAKIPHPFNQYDRESGNGEPLVRAHDARLVAASLVNPNNPTTDQDARTPDNAILGMGVDLNAQGIFWSLNDPPTAEELAKAEGRKERYYRGLIERARTLEISNPKELESVINQDYHMAAEHFGMETSWHKKFDKKIECPGCGDQIKEGVAVHSCGAVLNWDKAIALGLKTEEDRPSKRKSA